MTEYIKIETPFMRDMEGTKKLLEGVWRDKTLEYLKDCKFDCSEKVDGTNIGIVWDGHKVTFQGRTERANIPSHLTNCLIDLFGGETNEQLFEQKFGSTPVVLYGEGYGAKIQKGGGLYRSDVGFILFDVLVNGSLWLQRESVEDIARAFNIDVVPLVMRGTIQDAVDFVKTRPMSRISNSAPMEGLVCRPTVELYDRMGKRVIVKIKVRDFT